MKGFVTFVTPNYEELMKTTIESVIEFSEYPVVVCGVGYTPNIIEHERVIYKKLDKNLPNIFYYKFKCILESGLSEGIYIEADDILNYKIDDLFSECPTGQFPKGPIHPNDPNNQQKVMKLLGVTEKSQKYVHGHIIFSDTCRDFIQECLDFAMKHSNIGVNWDETIYNVMLWKYKVNNNYTEFVFDPYYKCYEDYLAEDRHTPTMTKHYHSDDIAYHMIHGSKDPKTSRQILDKLKANRKEVYSRCEK